MNKLTKIGASALCGSLATVSAYAGSLDVSGSATVTWSDAGGGATTTGNPIGINSAIAFKGSGELDNGWGVGLTIAHTDQATYSSAAINLTTNSLGTISFNGGDGGNGIDAFDDMIPTAWEETSGTSVGTGVDNVSGLGGSMNIQWKSPTMLGTYIAVAYTPKNDGAEPTDKNGSGETGGRKESATDARININASLGTDILSGLNIFAGGSRSEVNHVQATGGKEYGDHEEATAGITYALGPISLGIQRSIELTGSQADTDTEHYANTLYGAVFNVNDDLSISYGFQKSRRGFVDANQSESVSLEAESIQLAYSMGGASVKIAKTEVDNPNYDSASDRDKEGYTFALSLAF